MFTLRDVITRTYNFNTLVFLQTKLEIFQFMRQRSYTLSTLRALFESLIRKKRVLKMFKNLIRVRSSLCYLHTDNEVLSVLI